MTEWLARGKKRSDKIFDCGLVFGPMKLLRYCESSLKIFFYYSFFMFQGCKSIFYVLDYVIILILTILIKKKYL